MSITSRPPLRARVLGVLVALAPWAAAQQPSAPAAKPAAPAAKPGDDAGPLSQEQLEQMLAPLALYPDDLLSQILMASTYPLEIVLADRWAKAHKGATGDAAAKLLEQESWDASVKSLIATPDVLAMLSDKLDWTQQVGDAFISQQQDVMTAIQTLRKKAQESGHLKSDDKQTVEASGTTIVIESADPEVIYVPVYDTTVVYGSWPYPYYPPYAYYPPGYHYGVGVGIAIGFAWGYAWGHCDWHGGDVDIDIDRNVNRNRNIDRDAAKKKAGQLGQGGKGKWQHDPGHRGGLPYKDSATAKRFGGVTTKEAAQSRDAFRGKSDPLGSKGAGVADRAGGAGSRTAPSAANRPAPSPGNKSPSAGSREQRGTRSGAFDGADRAKGQTQRDSSRGRSSRSSGGGSRGGRGGGRGR